MKIGILSDAHGNIDAFQRAVSVLQERGCLRLFFLGDAVGYLPTLAVVKALRELDIPWIRGNHETMMLEGNIPAEQDDIYRLQATKSELSSELLGYIVSRPITHEMQSSCGRILLVHGSPLDPIFGYVYPDTDFSQFHGLEGTNVFMGHTHRPFIRRQNSTLFVNVGSCGLPRDCGHLGSACVFDDVTGETEIVQFDITLETRNALSRCSPVAPAVMQLLERRNPRL
jgi:predicted phosphodiesterase